MESTWSKEDNDQAFIEGWAIFTSTYGSAWQLQREDEQPTFDSDTQAWNFVREKAAAGSAYHQRALNFLKENAPEEYTEIMAS